MSKRDVRKLMALPFWLSENQPVDHNKNDEADGHNQANFRGDMSGAMHQSGDQEGG